MAKKYIDAEILVKWLEKRAEDEELAYCTRVVYELVASDIDIITDFLPSSEKLKEDLISSPDDLESLFQKYEEENPDIPTEEEQRKNKIFTAIIKFAYLYLFVSVGGIVLLLLLEYLM